MRRTIELRPKRRSKCDLRACRTPLKPGVRYPTLSEAGDYFAGVRVFCTVDHMEQYETNLVLARTRRRGDEQVPGFKRGGSGGQAFDYEETR